MKQGLSFLIIMKHVTLAKIFVFIFVLCNSVSAQGSASTLDKDFLSWNEKEAVKYGEVWRVNGRIGGYFDTRILSTDKSFNYKLRATLMSPEAIRATARFEQIRNSLTNEETLDLVAKAESENSLVIVVEVDPREGSGVIPNDWRGLLQTSKAMGESSNRTIRGLKKQSLREVTALKGVAKRDYNYDVFWITFPLKDENGKPYWTTVPAEIELVVGIYNKEGRVVWKVSDDLRTRIEALLK